MTKKIVVIDDEPDVLEIVRATLNTKGYDVVTFESGQEGLAHAEANPPDLIICDLLMPRVSGLEVIKRAKKTPALQEVPMIVISALGAEDHRPPEFWTRSLGVDDFIQKPFEPLDLLGRVEFIFRRGGYLSARPGGPPTPEDPGTETVPPVDVRSATPAEIVRTFIESWNKQDFATEFHCMDEDMIGRTDQHQYVSARRQTYVEERGHTRQQRLAQVIEEKVSLNVAKVVVDRVDNIAGTDQQRRETYTLRKTNRGWKIMNCKVAN